MALLVSTVSLQAGCLNAGLYVTFKQAGFSYAHPRGWTQSVERYPDFIHTIVWDPKISDNESSVSVFVDVRLGLGTNAEQEARNTLSQDIVAVSGEHNFSLIKQEDTTLDGVGGYKAEYTLDAVSSYDVIPEKRFYIPTRSVIMYIPRRGNVYKIWISASQNEWNAHEADIQHVLDTFMWR